MLATKQGRLINIAWEELEKFIRDWQHSPYEWNTERDIQTDIANRIKRRYKTLGMHKVKAVYKHYVAEGYEEGQLYNRVCCEPKTYYRDNRKSSGWSHPDIVIFDDLKNPNKPPDMDSEGNRTGKNFPMLWLCEIKYHPGYGNRPDKWDLDKIRYLRRGRDIDYACWLYVARERGKGNGVKRIKTGRTRIYKVTLPSLKRKGRAVK